MSNSSLFILPNCSSLSFPYCCQIKNFEVQIRMDPSIPLSYPVFDRVVLFVIILTTMFLFFQTRKDIYRHVRIYYKYLGFYGIFLAVKLVYLLAPIQLWEYGDRVFSMLVRCIDFSLEVWLVWFLFQKDLMASSIKKAAVCTAITLVIFAPIDIVPFFVLKKPMCYVGMATTDFTVALSLFIISFLPLKMFRNCIPSALRPRYAVIPWALYKCILHVLDALGSLLQILEQSIGCVQVLSSTLGCALMALVLYKVLSMDASYWKKKYSLLQNDEWLEDQKGAVIDVNPTKFGGLTMINWGDIHLEKLIGSGGFAQVYLAKWNSTKVAVKKLKVDALQGREEKVVITELLKESKFIAQLRHPNIVQFLGLSISLPNLAIVTSYMERGNLYNFLKGIREDVEQPITDIQKRKMLKDIAKGMNYLHTRNPVLLHRDLKSPNVLLDKNLRCKVTDFGLSRLSNNTSTTMTHLGTPLWLSPEILREEKYSEKADVWAYGVVVWEVVTCRHPYEGMTTIGVMSKVGYEDYKLTIPTGCKVIFSRIMQNCWENPENRMSFGQILKYFQDDSKNAKNHKLNLETVTSFASISADTATADKDSSTNDKISNEQISSQVFTIN